MSKVAIITGGSSGIGKCTAAELVKAGCTVYEFSRRDSSVPGINHISADITDETQVDQAVRQVIEKEGRLDILINNAGFGISGAMEFTSNEDAKRLMDVNLFGMVNMSKAVIPHMRQAGSGRIVNLSSVAAPVPIPFQIWYSISKASVSCFTMALANEVKPFGISVCAVLPGDIKTGFTAARKKNTQGDDIYVGRIAKSVAVMEHDEQNGMAPETAARFICKTALKKRVKLLAAIGFKYKFFVLLTRLLPVGLVNKIIGKLYA